MFIFSSLWVIQVPFLFQFFDCVISNCGFFSAVLGKNWHLNMQDFIVFAIPFNFLFQSVFSNFYSTLILSCGHFSVFVFS